MSQTEHLADGRAVKELTISGGGLTAKFLTLGSILRDLRLDGVPHRLTLGAAKLDDYLGNFRFGGGIVGPVANRIACATAPLAGRNLSLPANEGTTCLHGGAYGFDAQIWTVDEHRPDALVLSLELKYHEDGWPGNRRMTAHWSFPAAGTLALDLTASSDSDTLFAPAQHGYWNLGPGPDLTGHRLYSSASHYTEVNDIKIPTGRNLSVEGTPFDFRNGGAIGPEAAGRIDHNLCIQDRRGPLREHCRLEGPSAKLTILSTEPGLQVYDAGHFAQREVIDLDGKRLAGFAGLALEPQLYPDAANHPEWQSPILLAGEVYRQITHWQIERR